MQDQNKKIIRWVVGGGILALFLTIPEILIAKLISNNNPEVYESYVITMAVIIIFIYLTVSVIQFVKYQKYANNYKQEKIEKASKELTSEFKPVLLNYSEPISKDLFKCQAKIGDDGKIVCKIELDYEVKIENYEEFLRHFHFN